MYYHEVTSHSKSIRFTESIRYAGSHFKWEIQCPISKEDAVIAIAYWYKSPRLSTCSQLLYDIKARHPEFAHLLILPSKSVFEGS